MNVGVLAVVAAAVALAAWLATYLSGVPLVGYDEANIFFVYARNLVDGHGFVYNAGGERVEGFTSLSWVLICAAARAVTDRHEILLFATNVLVISVALWRLAALLADMLVRFEVADRRHVVMWSLALTLAVALAPGYVIWGVVSLMDSGLWMSLLLLSAVGTVRLAMGDPLTARGRILTLLVIAMVLTRPESLLWGPVFLVLWIAVAMAHGAGWKGALRQHAASVIAFAVTTAALLAWRLTYFGYPFPNAYYAKTGDPVDLRVGSGLLYLWDFAAGNPVVLLALATAIATAVAASVRYARTRDGLTFRVLVAELCVLVLFAAGAAIPLINGGDHFGFWRLGQPLAPLVAIQATLSAAMLALARPAERQAAVAACAMAILFALAPWRYWASLGEISYPSAGVPGYGWNTARREVGIADDMRGIGAAFNRAFPNRKPSVGVIHSGGFALEYRGVTMDLMGFNHVAMAHSPGPRTNGARNHMAFHPDVFYTLAPDVLLLSLWAPQRPDWFNFPMLSGEFEAPPYDRPDYFLRRNINMNYFDAGLLKGVLHNTRTAELYQWAAVRPAGGTRWIHALFKKDFLQELGRSGYDIALPGPQK